MSRPHHGGEDPKPAHRQRCTILAGMPYPNFLTGSGGTSPMSETPSTKCQKCQERSENSPGRASCSTFRNSASPNPCRSFSTSSSVPIFMTCAITRWRSETGWFRGHHQMYLREYGDKSMAIILRSNVASHLLNRPELDASARVHSNMRANGYALRHLSNNSSACDGNNPSSKPRSAD
jgi:hypothetical protein